MVNGFSRPISEGDESWEESPRDEVERLAEVSKGSLDHINEADEQFHYDEADEDFDLVENSEEKKRAEIVEDEMEEEEGDN